MNWVADKLVRDRVPDLIAAEGAVAITRELSDREFGRALRTALQDSFRTYMARPSVQNMAELCETLEAVQRLNGHTAEEIAAARRQLREHQGGYDRRLRLEEIAQPQPAAAPAAPPAPAHAGDDDAVEDATVVSSRPLDERP